VGTGFHGELTGRENIYLNGAILGMKKRRITEKMDEITAFSGIENHIDTPVKRYSSGMHVRLAFAVAAHLDSDILIADEVLAVGDAEFQKKALGKMQDLSTGQGRTVLFVSHNMGAVRNLCTCGVVLEKGRIREASDDINNLITDYLNNFEGTKTLTKWINNGEIHDPYFTPISMEFQEADGKSISTGISSDKAYRIELIYRVEVIDPSMYFFINLHNEEGASFLGSEGIINSEYGSELGTFSSFFSIPANTLNCNEFTIVLCAQLKNIKYIIDWRTQEVSLTIRVNNYIAPIKWRRSSKLD
jgi:lipopolysaccharide transport system ATP-binding protein